MNKEFSVKAITLLFLFFFSVPSTAWTELPAFPGAEGYGSTTKGGRGGTIYKVTNLNDSGSGSLRACIEASGPRTCVFGVSGWINLTSGITVTNPYLTIAGQTAQGGIGLRNTQNRTATYPILVRTHDVVIRYLTIRPGPGNTTANADSIASDPPSRGSNYNIIVDHCSLSWTDDDILAIGADSYNVTLSYLLGTDPLQSPHTKDMNHGMGMVLGYYKDVSGDIAYPGRNQSMHHCFIAHTYERNPMIDNGGINDVVNNILYNTFGANMMVYGESSVLNRVNIVKNYMKRGPHDQAKPLVKAYLCTSGGCEYYLQGNYLSGTSGYYRTSDSQSELNVVDSGQRVVGAQNTTDGTYHYVTSRFDGPPAITQQSPFDGTLVTEVTTKAGNYQYVDCNGEWQSRRDAVDKRVIFEFTNGTAPVASDKLLDAPSAATCLAATGCRGSGYYLTLANYTAAGIDSSELETTGDYILWPVMGGVAACTDTDSDGMPDAWETARDLNPSSSADAITDRDGDGYTNLEEFINGLSRAGETEPEPPANLRLAP